jgi:hypothetical protein
MGLDITAYAVPAGVSEATELHDWRKHHELLKWCESLAMQRGEAAWDEPAQSIVLTSVDLDKLATAVTNGELPDHYARADHWRAQDLEFIDKARAAIAAGMTVEIVFSW